MKMQLQFVCAVLLALAVITAPAAEWAPKRPVRMIVPFPPGGAVDSVARIVAVGLPERLGQQVVTTARRSAALPDVPTIAEAGVPGYEVDGWYGLLAPAATPPAVIARFNRELTQLLD
jgi:tripartite-type tricarboxylate transporter receptor subunit TctC